jgi:hypothetical protein
VYYLGVYLLPDQSLSARFALAEHRALLSIPIDIRNFFLNWDVFLVAPGPSLGGQSGMGSLLSIIASLIAYAWLFYYVITSFLDFVRRVNPSINQVKHNYRLAYFYL